MFRSGAGGDRQGLGTETGELNEDDDEFDTYRKRMMLAYRFRPNPLVWNGWLLASLFQKGT